MARARNIKPGILKNEVLGTADEKYTILFIGLWTLADREGRLEDRPLRIKAEVFPLRERVNVGEMLDWLAENGFIDRYEADGHKCIWINKFRDHQRPHRNEAQSALPPSPLDDQGRKRRRAKVASADDQNEKHVALTPDSLLSESLCAESLLCPEVGDADSGPRNEDPVVMEFPCKGTGARGWPLLASKVVEYRDSFPGVNLDAELRKARQWLLDRPTRQKTYDGMAKFLGGWLGRAQNDPRAPPGKAPVAARAMDGIQDFLSKGT